MNLNIKTLLNHKVVAVVNLLWAIFHIWIAIAIDQDYFFLGVVIVFMLIFIGAYRTNEKKARYIFLVIGLLYFIPLVDGVIPSLFSGESIDAWFLASIIWLVVFAWTLLAGTAQWTGLGKSKSEDSD